MPSITQFSLNADRITVLFVVLIVITGIGAFLNYPKQEDPTITIREAVVTAAFPGMAPLRVEDLITRKLEEKIREIGEVDEITSDSKTGMSVLHVTIKDEVEDLDLVFQDIRNKMNDVRPELPQGTLGPFVDDEFGLTAVATIALWSDGFTLAEMRQVARNARDRLYSVEGIQKVDLFGIQDERVYLELQNSKMAQFGISPGVIVDILRRQNIILPGGTANVDGQDIVIEPSGNFNDVVEIQSVVISIPGTEQTVPLRDLVTTVRGYVDPPEAPVFFQGRQAVVLSVSTLEGVNSVEFGERLTRKVKELERALPIGYVMEYATYQPDLVIANVNGAVNNLFQTLVIVLLVVIIFLGIRTGLIVGSFVPMAMLMGLVIMYAIEIEFQRMSIAAMIIALGMLVDNGIVVAEDIRARIDQGWNRREAALEAGKVLAVPLLTSSLTTILFFGPLMLMVGSTGEYTVSLGQVLIITLMSSWFLAMFVTPIMCVWFMRGKENPGKKESDTADDSGERDLYDTRLYRMYRHLLERMLRIRLVVVAVVIAALIGAGYSFRFVAKEFFPANDRNQFLVYLDLPAGSHINTTAETTTELVAWLEDKTANPEITGTIAYVGSGGPRFFLSLSPTDPDPHRAFLIVNTKTSKQVPSLVKRVNAWSRQNLPNGRVSPKAMWLGPSETGLLEIRLNGPDRDSLRAKAEQLEAALRAIPGTINIEQDWENKVLTRISQTHLGGVSSGADEPGCGSICVALRQSGPGLIV